MVSIGDTIAQRVVEKKSKQDFKRTARFAIFNFFLVGPALRVWYFRLEKLYHANNFWSPLKKVVTDQLLFAPCFLAMSLIVLDLMKGNDINAVKSNFSSIYLDVLQNNYKIWPFAQLINFYFVPLNLRVIFACFVSILWNTYFTWKVESKQ